MHLSFFPSFRDLALLANKSSIPRTNKNLTKRWSLDNLSGVEEKREIKINQKNKIREEVSETKNKSENVGLMKEGWILGKLVDLVRDSAKLTRMGCTRRPLTVRRHYLTNESGYGPRQQPCAQLTLLNAFTIEKLRSFRLHQPSSPPCLPPPSPSIPRIIRYTPSGLTLPFSLPTPTDSSTGYRDISNTRMDGRRPASLVSGS